MIFLLWLGVVVVVDYLAAAARVDYFRKRQEALLLEILILLP